MSATEAVAVVNQIVNALLATERYIAKREPWARYMFDTAIEAALGDGTAKGHVPPIPKHIDNALLRQIVFSAQDAATRRLWQRSRIVLDIDEDLWNELGEIDEDTVLPGAVFDHLPYPDVFITWPATPRTPLEEGTYLHQVGCFITGQTRVDIKDADLGDDGGFRPLKSRLGWPVSTHSEHAGGELSVTIVSSVEDASGRVRMVPGMGVPDEVVSRCTLNIRGGETFRVGDLIQSIADRYTYDVLWDDSAVFDVTVRPTLRRIIAVLLYLCSTNADARTTPTIAARRAARGTSMAQKPPRVVEVGYVVGAGLRAWRRSQSEPSGPSESTGKRQRPHIRRAHPHLYWTGEGRQTPRIRWLFPIRINMDAGSVTTVQPVRGSTRKG